jgi:hypothetical protein
LTGKLNSPTFIQTVLGPFFARRTYLGLVYALAGLPLGTFYFCFIVTGLSLGLGLLVTLVGIPVLVLTLAGCRGLAQLERTLTASLLGASIPRVRIERERGFFWRRLVGQLRSSATWRELAYLLIRFPTGIASFTIAVSVIALPVSLLVQPFLVAFGVSGMQINSWHVDTFGRALLLVPPGLALLLVAPAIISAQARVERALATFFLARVPRADFRRAVAHFLARGDSDAFSLLSDLELYFSPGPYVTANRLKANLLALEDLDLVSVERDGSRDRYSLSAKGQKAFARL